MEFIWSRIPPLLYGCIPHERRLVLNVVKLTKAAELDNSMKSYSFTIHCEPKNAVGFTFRRCSRNEQAKA